MKNDERYKIFIHWFCQNKVDGQEDITLIEVSEQWMVIEIIKALANPTIDRIEVLDNDK